MDACAFIRPLRPCTRHLHRLFIASFNASLARGDHFTFEDDFKTTRSLSSVISARIPKHSIHASDKSAEVEPNDAGIKPLATIMAGRRFDEPV